MGGEQIEQRLKKHFLYGLRWVQLQVVLDVENLHRIAAEEAEVRSGLGLGHCKTETTAEQPVWCSCCH